ncbi:MAG: hypothetical protein J0H26_14595, partial [Alphaproteobacteria bacterium]|nr:hypothetical protein [Alphaproteobacteria bacterium]
MRRLPRGADQQNENGRQQPNSRAAHPHQFIKRSEQNQIHQNHNFALVLCVVAQFIGKPVPTFPIALSSMRVRPHLAVGEEQKAGQHDQERHHA